MSLTVTIGGTDVTGKLARNSFSLTNAIGQRDTLALSVVSKDGTYRPPAGSPVVVTHSDLGVQFGGTIRRTQTGLRGVEILSALQCASWEQIFDRRLCGQVSYTDQPAGDVVTDILTRYCGAEGVTASIITAGPNISASFDFCTVRDAFDSICALASDATDTYMWDCTPGKVLRFYRQTSFAAPIDVTEDRTDIFRNIVVTRSFDNYVNKVFVRLGKYITEERTNTYHPDGTQRSFSFEIPLAKTPTITLDGVAQTVGIRGTDTGKQWYWQDNSAEVTQDPGETIPSDTSTLVIVAQGYQSTVIDAASDDAEITARGDVESNSGYYMTLIESSDPGTSADGVALAQAHLAKYGKVPYAVEYQTTYGGIKAGQHQRIHLTKFGEAFDETFIVESSTLSQENGLWSWRVRAINGALANNWLTKLRSIAQKGSGGVSGGASSGGGGSAPAPPGNVTIGTITVDPAHYSPTGTGKGRRMVGKRPVAIAFTRPDPVGTFAGVYVSVAPDDGGATPGMGDTVGLGTTVSLSGAAPQQFGPFAYSETGDAIRIELPEPNWRAGAAAVTERVTLCSYSVDMVNDASTSPSATFTLAPPSTSKPGAATAHCQNPTGVSIPATFADGTPNPWVDTSGGGVSRTHLLVHQDAPDDPSFAGVAWRVSDDPDGLEIINASGLQKEADFELVFNTPTSIITGYVWACGVDEAGDINPIVPGITPVATVTLGTTGGTVDLGAALSGSFNGEHFDLVGGEFIISGVPLGDKIATDVAAHLDVVSGVLGVKASGITAGLVAAAAIGNTHIDRATANKLAIVDADIVNLSAAKITAGTLAADVIYGGTIAANKITAGTLGAGVIYTGTLAADKITAGTISAAVSLTSPTLTITSGTVTVNIDATNFIKIVDSSISRKISFPGGVAVRVGATDDSYLNQIDHTQMQIKDSSGISAEYRVGQIIYRAVGGTVLGQIQAQAIYFGGNQVLGLRQTGPGNASGWSDSGAQTWANNLLTALRNHGLVT